MQRPQAVDDLEHEAEHQTGGGKAETEEQADAGLVEGLGQGAAVLGHHQSEDPIRTGQQHGAGHDQQRLLVGPLADEEVGIAKGGLEAIALQVGIPQGTGAPHHIAAQFQLPVVAGVGLIETGIGEGAGDHRQAGFGHFQPGEQIIELQAQAIGLRLLPVVAHHGLQTETGGEQKQPTPDQRDGDQSPPQGSDQPHSLIRYPRPRTVSIRLGLVFLRIRPMNTSTVLESRSKS